MLLAQQVKGLECTFCLQNLGFKAGSQEALGASPKQRQEGALRAASAASWGMLLCKGECPDVLTAEKNCKQES